MKYIVFDQVRHFLLTDALHHRTVALKFYLFLPPPAADLKELLASTWTQMIKPNQLLCRGGCDSAGINTKEVGF